MTDPAAVAVDDQLDAARRSVFAKLVAWQQAIPTTPPGREAHHLAMHASNALVGHIERSPLSNLDELVALSVKAVELLMLDARAHVARNGRVSLGGGLMELIDEKPGDLAYLTIHDDPTSDEPPDPHVLCAMRVVTAGWNRDTASVEALVGALAAEYGLAEVLELVADLAQLAAPITGLATSG